MHVTLKLADGRPNLRTYRFVRAVSHALLGASGRADFRIAHFCVLRNHLHLIVEAHNARALSSGMRAFSIRLARRVNLLARTRGQVIAHRYHAHILRTPREVRLALRYVLSNQARHAGHAPWRARYADRFSSAPVFDGWRTPPKNAVASTSLITTARLAPHDGLAPSRAAVTRRRPREVQG